MFRGFAPRRIETYELNVAGLDAPVTVRRSPRARRLTLSVNEARRNGILTIPTHVSLEEAGDFLSRHFEWLRDRLMAMPEAVPFADGLVVPLRGQDHSIEFVGNARRRGVVWTEPAALAAADIEHTRTPPRLCVAGDETHGPRRLKDWLIREARKDLTERTNWHAENLGLTPKRITIRDQTTRWGSCSSNGVLSYSWRVVLAPPFVLDYLAAHEVTHLKEMNHSKRFWALVRETLPDMDRGRKWLRQNGAALHRYGADA